MYPLLYLPSRAYAWLMSLRRKWFEDEILASHNTEMPTISIGNIRWGGTGKTPLTEWLLAWSIDNGLAPAVLTRGYKANPPGPAYLVRPESTPQEAGDEPILLARSCPEAYIVVDPNRTRAAKWVQREFRPSIYLLDDGFQHLKIQRHVDLVLLSPNDLIQDWNRVIPAGPWREGEDALTRASAFLIRAPEDEFYALEPLVREYLAPYKAPVFNFAFSPTGLTRLDQPKNARDLEGGKYLLVSGVGEHEQVQATAESLLGYPPEKHLRFDDHHNYSQGDWDYIRKQADLANAEHVLATGKDAVKLTNFKTWGLWTFQHTLTFSGGFFTKQTFPEWWEETWELI